MFLCIKLFQLCIKLFFKLCIKLLVHVHLNLSINKVICYYICYFFTVNHGTFDTPVGLKSRYWKFVFKHPSNIFISGPSGLGKTEFVKMMIEFKVDLFDILPQHKDDEKIKLWFTRKGHHRNASVVYITQNLFQQSKSSRTISLNAHYLVYFKVQEIRCKLKY